jgi:hypothetical protein
VPRLLKDLRIDDVSSVDVGAGKKVRVLLTKRDTATKREFSQGERDSAADSGAALPDGSFPIKSEQDLRNAIRAIGRAKNPEKARAHVKARARALGLTDLIPDTWSKRDDRADELSKAIDDLREGLIAKAAIDYEVASANIEVGESTQALMGELREALCALETSICSIFCDDDVADKAAAIDDSFEQFKEHIGSFSFADAEHPDVEFDKALEGYDPDVANADLEQEFETVEKSMSITLPEKLQKIVDEAVAKAVADVEAKKSAETAALKTEIEKRDAEIVLAKMSDKHKAFHDNLDGEERKKFASMSPEERDAHMEKTRKRYDEDPIYKSMREENESLRKRIERIEDERGLEIAKLEAKELGMTQKNAGDIVLKMKRSCDEDTYNAWKDHTKQLMKQRDAFAKQSHAFDEIGSALGNVGGGTALDELNQKRDELRKSKPELTEAQAFEKVMLDPANRELMAREKQERMNKIYRQAS